MSDENGKVENHTLVLLREIRDRLDRIEGTQAEHSATLAQQGATLAGHSATLAQHSQTLAEHGGLLDALVKAVTAIDANQQKQTEILKEHSKKLDGLTDLGRNHGGAAERDRRPPGPHRRARWSRPSLTRPAPYKPVLRRQFSDYCNASCAGRRGCKGGGTPA